VVTEADFGLAAAPDQLAALAERARQVPELTVLYESPAALCYRLATRAPSVHSGLN